MTRNQAVREALKDARDKGKLKIASLLYSISEKRLRAYADGNDEVLSDSELEYISQDLKDAHRS